MRNVPPTFCGFKAMPARQATAIVIGSFDYGESDRIVTFFTLENGKVKGIAKGARRSWRRFSNCLDLFCHVRIHFFEKEHRSLARIDQCDPLELFPALSQDVAKMSYGSYFAELVDAMVGEGEPSRELFDLLRIFLSVLNRQEPREEMLRIFEMRLLSTLGYRPYLNACVRCQRPVDRVEKIFFAPATGGILCETCCAPKDELFPIAIGTIKLLERSAQTDLAKVDRLRFSARSLTESRDILPHFLQRHLGRPLKSVRFLEMAKLGPPGVP